MHYNPYNLVQKCIGTQQTYKITGNNPLYLQLVLLCDMTCNIHHEFTSSDTNNSLKSRLDMKDNRKCITNYNLVANLDLKPLLYWPIQEVSIMASDSIKNYMYINLQLHVHVIPDNKHLYTVQTSMSNLFIFYHKTQSKV